MNATDNNAEINFNIYFDCFLPIGDDYRSQGRIFGVKLGVVNGPESMKQ